MRVVPVLMLFVHLATTQSALAQPAKAPRLDFNGDPLPEGAVARLGTTRFTAPNDFYGAALSSDGKTVVLVKRDRVLKGKELQVGFMSTSTGKIIRELTIVGSNGYFDPRFSLDANNLTITDSSGVQVFDSVTGKLVKSMRFSNDGQSRVAISPDGKLVAHQPSKIVQDAPVYIYEMSTGEEVAKLPGRGSHSYDLSFSKDGKRLLLFSIIPTLDGKGGMRLGSDSDCAVVSIDIEKRKIVGETTVVRQQVQLNQDGETVAITAKGGASVSIRHLPTGAERCVIPVKTFTFAFTPDGTALCTIDENCKATLWDAATGKKIRDFESVIAPNGNFHILGMSKEGATIAGVAGGQTSAPFVAIWNTATGKRIDRPLGHEGSVSCIAYLPGNKLLASGSNDKTVRLWNVATGEHLRILTTHDSEVTAIAVSPDGKLIVSAASLGAIRLLNITDGKVVREFTLPAQEINVLAFSQDGTQLFARGEESDLLAWEIVSGKEVVRLKTGRGSVMAFGKGGGLALIKNSENPEDSAQDRLQVWNPTKKQWGVSISLGDKISRFTRCDGAIISLDGRTIISSQTIDKNPFDRPSDGSGKLRLWERTSGELIRTVAPTLTDVLAFTPDGRILASGNMSKLSSYFIGHISRVDLWDVVTGKKISTLPVLPSCLAFSSDGSHLAVGGQDHCILIWETPKIQAPKKAGAPSPMVRDEWWTALGGKAEDAYKAMGQMIEVPEYALDLLKERVRPVQASNSDETAKLIRQLDSEAFAEREKAQKELAKLGENAAHQLMKALEVEESGEARRRIQALLDKFNENSVLGRQQLRSVALLEWIGTHAARKLLRELAGGAPEARLTTEARAALKRLESR